MGGARLVTRGWPRILPVLAALLIGGCTPAAAPATDVAATQSPTSTRSPATSTAGPDDDFSALMRDLVHGRGDGGELDQLWRDITRGAWADRGLAYEPPTRVIAYRGGEEVPDTPCAIGTVVSFWRENARYCAEDASIYYDEAWLRAFESRAGRFAPAAIMAHEWGHHVQALSGEQVFAELQADCFAGIYLGASEHVTGDVYELRDAELQSGLAAFFSIGDRDYSASEWFQTTNVGSQQQRILAFGTGYLGSFGEWGEYGDLVNGYPWCYGYRDFEPQDFAHIGPYRLINFPGREEEWQAGTYFISPEERTAYETSRLRLAWTDLLPIEGEEATLDQLAAVAAMHMPGTELLYEEVPVLTDSGSALSHYFQRSVEGGSGADAVESGMLALIVPENGSGGLLMAASRDRPAEQDPLDRAKLAVLFEEMSSLYQVINRLCGPDDAADLGDPALNTACLDEH